MLLLLPLLPLLPGRTASWTDAAAAAVTTNGIKRPSKPLLLPAACCPAAAHLYCSKRDLGMKVSRLYLVVVVLLPQ